MKTYCKSLTAWALMLIAFSIQALAADMSFTQYTNLLIKAGVISAEKSTLALEAAQSADNGRPVTMKNLATMGEITRSDAKITGGLVLGPGQSGRFLIRAVGPTLQTFGVQGALMDPRLTAYKSGKAFAGNDDWGVSDAARIADSAAKSGAFPLASGSYDAAMVLDLTEGDYTFVVEAMKETTGTVLLEIYRVP